MNFDETTVRQAYEFVDACRRATAADAAMIILVKEYGKDAQTIHVPCSRQQVDQKKMSTAVADSMIYALSEFFGDGVEILLRVKSNGNTVTADEFLGTSRSETIHIER